MQGILPCINELLTAKWLADYVIHYYAHLSRTVSQLSTKTDLHDLSLKRDPLFIDHSVLEEELNTRETQGNLLRRDPRLKTWPTFKVCF